jgi:hypothetical protein
MKKVYGLFILLLFAKTLAAQDADSRSAKDVDGTGFEGALRVTPIFMWTKVDVEDTRYTASNEGLKLGFAYGVMGDYYFAKNAGFSAELRVAHLAGSFSVKDTANTTRTNTLRLQYIEVPFTLKMRTGEVGYMRYFGQFGIMPSFNIKAKRDEVLTAGTTTITTTDIPASKQMIPIGLSLVIGAGTTYNLGGSTSLLGGISFHNGFTNMVKVKDFNAKVKPAYLAVNLGVIF